MSVVVTHRSCEVEVLLPRISRSRGVCTCRQMGRKSVLPQNSRQICARVPILPKEYTSILFKPVSLWHTRPAITRQQSSRSSLDIQRLAVFDEICTPNPRAIASEDTCREAKPAQNEMSVRRIYDGPELKNSEMASIISLQLAGHTVSAPHPCGSQELLVPVIATKH